MAGVAEVPRAYDGHRCHLAALMHYKDVSEREAEPIHTHNGDYSIREAMASAHQAAAVIGHKRSSSGSGSAMGREFLRQRKPQRDAEMPDAQQELARALDSEKLRARLGHKACTMLDMAAGNSTMGGDW
jgi:hypothetical protein